MAYTVELDNSSFGRYSRPLPGTIEAELQPLYNGVKNFLVRELVGKNFDSIGGIRKVLGRYPEFMRKKGIDTDTDNFGDFSTLVLFTDGTIGFPYVFSRRVCLANLIETSKSKQT